MDADVAAFQKFIETSLVIEAPAGSRKASQAAVAIASGRVNRGAAVSFKDVRGEGLDAKTYGAVVEDIRKQIAADLSRPDYRIEVFDRSTKDPAAEGRRIDKGLAHFARGVVAHPDEGAFAQGMNLPSGKACVVVGFPASTGLQPFFSRAIGIPVKTKAIDDVNAHRMFLWHELGHCLLGASEAKADTFAALMVLRHTKLEGAIDLLATWREVLEFISDRGDDHFMSASLRAVSARAEALRADKRFMSMDIKEIAALAKSMSDEFAASPAEVKDAMTVRSALAEAQGLKAHYVRTDEGLRRVGFGEWVNANAAIPELGRIKDAFERLANGTTGRQEAYTIDLPALRASLAVLAAQGDSTARAMVKGLDRGRKSKAAAHDEGIGVAIPYDFRQDPYHGQVIAFDRSCQKAIVSDDGGRYAIHDGRAVIEHGDLTTLAANAENVASVGLRR